jgi:hypothetical protein
MTQIRRLNYDAASGARTDRRAKVSSGPIDGIVVEHSQRKSRWGDSRNSHVGGVEDDEAQVVSREH